jgi:hypothetical protein
MRGEAGVEIRRGGGSRTRGAGDGGTGVGSRRATSGGSGDAYNSGIPGSESASASACLCGSPSSSASVSQAEVLLGSPFSSPSSSSHSLREVLLAEEIAVSSLTTVSETGVSSLAGFFLARRTFRSTDTRSARPRLANDSVLILATSSPATAFACSFLRFITFATAAIALRAFLDMPAGTGVSARLRGRPRFRGDASSSGRAHLRGRPGLRFVASSAARTLADGTRGRALLRCVAGSASGVCSTLRRFLGGADSDTGAVRPPGLGALAESALIVGAPAAASLRSITGSNGCVTLFPALAPTLGSSGVI